MRFWGSLARASSPPEAKVFRTIPGVWWNKGFDEKDGWTNDECVSEMSSMVENDLDFYLLYWMI